MTTLCANAPGPPYSISALLATLVLLFAFQGQATVKEPLVIAMLAVPILIQMFFDSGFAMPGSNRKSSSILSSRLIETRGKTRSPARALKARTLPIESGTPYAELIRGDSLLSNESLLVKHRVLRLRLRSIYFQRIEAPSGSHKVYPLDSNVTGRHSLFLFRLRMHSGSTPSGVNLLPRDLPMPVRRRAIDERQSTPVTI